MIGVDLLLIVLVVKVGVVVFVCSEVLVCVVCCGVLVDL